MHYIGNENYNTEVQKMKAEDLYLTSHAKERIRQRLNIESDVVATTWVSDSIRSAKGVRSVDNKTHYETDSYEIVCDGTRVVTIIPLESNNPYIDKISSTLDRELQKMLTLKKRELRKAEIEVCEKQLNFLKAKNPNTIALISKRLVKAIDMKERIVDSIYQINKAASRYGIELDS